MAEIAGVRSLQGHDDLYMIGEYASMFGKDPDLEVFPLVRLDTFFAFILMWRKDSNFNHRYNYFWNKLSENDYGIAGNKENF